MELISSEELTGTRKNVNYIIDNFLNNIKYPRNGYKFSDNKGVDG